MKALQNAVHVYTNSPELDGEHLSRCYHSLVQLVMGKEEVGEKGEEGQAWMLFNQILDLLDSKAKVCAYGHFTNLYVGNPLYNSQVIKSELGLVYGIRRPPHYSGHFVRS